MRQTLTVQVFPAGKGELLLCTVGSRLYGCYLTSPAAVTLLLRKLENLCVIERKEASFEAVYGHRRLIELNLEQFLFVLKLGLGGKEFLSPEERQQLLHPITKASPDPGSAPSKRRLRAGRNAARQRLSPLSPLPLASPSVAKASIERLHAELDEALRAHRPQRARQIVERIAHIRREFFVLPRALPPTEEWKDRLEDLHTQLNQALAERDHVRAMKIVAEIQRIRQALESRPPRKEGERR